MSITESEANFVARATALQLDKAVTDKFVAAGVNCMSKFAFMGAHIPGNGDEKPFVTAVESVLGRPATIAEMSVLRRPFHESYDLTVSELQTQVDRTDESAPRKLAAPDCADRLAAQQARLTGLSIKGVLMPSHKLVDNAAKSTRTIACNTSPCTSALTVTPRSGKLRIKMIRFCPWIAQELSSQHSTSLSATCPMSCLPNTRSPVAPLDSYLWIA